MTGNRARAQRGTNRRGQTTEQPSHSLSRDVSPLRFHCRLVRLEFNVRTATYVAALSERRDSGSSVRDRRYNLPELNFCMDERNLEKAK